MPAKECLRPDFTLKLKNRLLRGESINLISQHGQGRRRTLEDLRSLLPDSIAVQQLDLRRDPVDPVDWLSEAVNSSRNSLLILHNFDELNEETNSNQQFIEQLNSIEMQPTISLLSVAEKRAVQSLRTTPLLLPVLTSKQLCRELERHQPKLPENKLAEVANRLLLDKAPYTALLSAVSEMAGNA
ncbi:hypothetical protein ACFL4M_02050 [Pseudomonadota bacterium]